MHNTTPCYDCHLIAFHTLLEEYSITQNLESSSNLVDTNLGHIRNDFFNIRLLALMVEYAELSPASIV